MKLIWCFLCCLLFLVKGDKICLDNEYRDACQQIERDNAVRCQTVASKVDCILETARGDPVLSVLTAEEALLGASSELLNTVVIGEVIANAYETVVLVRSGLSLNFASTGIRYCHPGYTHTELITKYVLEEFDKKFISYSCNSSMTLVEQKYQALASRFGPSCRPGQWTEDSDLDATLKAKYSSLCELCGDDGCNTQYTVPFRETLDCLTKINGGEVALTTAYYANEFLSTPENLASFQYWCPDGTISPVQCIWTNQTQRLVITSSSSAANMQQYLRNQLGSYIVGGSSSTSITQSLARVFELGSTEKVSLVDPVGLRDYVTRHRDIPAANDSIRCNLTVRWSATNVDELRKCQWLRQAAVNVGLQPVIDCAQSELNDTVSNMDNISANVADVAFVEASYGYIARRKNLTNVAYLETDRRQLSRIVLVLRNDSDWFSNFESLRGKSVCLPEYGGKEWLVLIDTLIRNRVLESSCDYGGLLGGFVGGSCAPGALDTNLDIPNTNDVVFCEKCVPFSPVATARYCSADFGNRFYGSNGSLACLSDGSADYAVISLNDLPRRHDFNLEHFRGVAANGSIADLAGFYTDDNAPLAVITAGEILIQRNSSKLQDVVQLLRGVEREFGQNLEKPFKVFERFDGIYDLLFPDSTPGITISGNGNRYIKRFQELLETPESCAVAGSPTTPSGAQQIVPALVFPFLIFTVYSILFM